MLDRFLRPDYNEAVTTPQPSRLRRNRNRSRPSSTDPDKPMSTNKRPPVDTWDESPDAELKVLAGWFEEQHAARERFGWVLRDSLDELLDGNRTGRWCYQQLKKTEKTYLGTAIEINLMHEFEISEESSLDWRILDSELDCKFSKDFGGWEIPMEMYLCPDHGEQSGSADQIALLLWMCDDTREWAAGLIRITDSKLKFKADGSRQYNRDNKRKLTDEGMLTIRWLWGGGQADLPKNLLLTLDGESRTQVLSRRSGQKRVNALFEMVQNEVVVRAAVGTVAQQDDPMKRARDARLSKNLGKEGFLVLGHQDADPHIAEGLGLPVPFKGEFVSCRIVPASRGDGVWLGKGWWKLATDESAVPAPQRKNYRKLSRDEIRHGRS